MYERNPASKAGHEGQDRGRSRMATGPRKGAVDEADLPDMHYITVGKSGLALFRHESIEESVLGQHARDSFRESTVRLTRFSADGALLGVSDGREFVRVLDVSTGQVVCEWKEANIAAIAFSPKNSFIITFRKWVKGTDVQEPEPNLTLRLIATGEILCRFHQRVLDADNWPSLQFTDDESLMGRLVTNEVHVYDKNALMTAKPAKKLVFHGVNGFAIGGASDTPFVAAFKPEAKGQPGQLRLYKYPNLNEGQQLVQKAVFRSQSFRVLFNAPLYSAALILLQADVDATGKSYYGETQLYHVPLQDKPSFQRVPLEKDGPVHDLKWSPTGREFIAVHGFMPAKTIMFDQFNRPRYDFGSAAINSVEWAPHGRFLALFGFGNLTGQVNLWDKNKLKMMGSFIASNAQKLMWSPDSRLMLTCTLTPRLRVDNGYNLWRYNGDHVGHLAVDELYNVEWQPAAAGIYPDRPQTPQDRRAKKDAQSSASGTGGGAAAPAQAAPAAPQRYIPPALRNKVGASSAGVDAIKAKLREGTETGPKKYIPAPAKPSARLPPGAPPPNAGASKTAERNRRRREKKKAEKEIAAVSEGVGAASISDSSSSKNESDPAYIEKRTKTLQKKLQQIDELKERQRGGEELNEDQILKIKSGHKFREELERLSASLP